MHRDEYFRQSDYTSDIYPQRFLVQLEESSGCQQAWKCGIIWPPTLVSENRLMRMQMAIEIGFHHAPKISQTSRELSTKNKAV